MSSLILPIIIPIAASIIILTIPERLRAGKDIMSIFATLANLVISFYLFNVNSIYAVSWFGNFEFSLRIYNFSAFILTAVSAFGFLVTLYSIVFMRGRDFSKLFFIYLLLSLAFVNGAVLSDNLLAMLFFWEGLLITLFGMIVIGRKGAFRTAIKALVIVGICDLCLMVGIVIAGHLAGTLMISKINIPVTGLGGLAFILLMIGAISKAGSMPFHSWIPDAAIDAPLPFMAIFPAALEKLLGIYFLTRISLDMFRMELNSWLSYTMMTVGAITIILAVMMALVQKDYKRLLSYHAISQVGYMILGVGTLVPAGIIGGLFHMVNNAMYKSCLFLTGGSVEKQTGTTDLGKLGGIARNMPVTFACFVVASLSISGVPPFNGFFSKELVYDGALERGMVFYLAAVIGSFFTAASFLKLGHAAFLGKRSEENRSVKEAPFVMLAPMIVIALGCIVFGIYNSLPIGKLIQPILGERATGHSFSGMPANMTLVVVTVAVLLAALLNHIYGVKKSGSGLKAVDHIHYAPGLHQIYDRAEKRYFDPYEISRHAVLVFSKILQSIDKAIDWVYNDLIVAVSDSLSALVRNVHTGSYRLYIAWSIAGAVAVVAVILLSSI